MPLHWHSIILYEFLCVFLEKNNVEHEQQTTENKMIYDDKAHTQHWLYGVVSLKQWNICAPYIIRLVSELLFKITVVSVDGIAV